MNSIFVTGAASGIGRATAELFASRGYFVGLFDVDGAAVAALAAQLGAGRAIAGELDVRDLGAFRASVAAFGAAAGGRMDVLFNCAGILRMGPFDKVPAEDAHLEIAVNVGGVVNGIYASLPLLEATSGSVIVNMSSVSAVYGTPDHSVYSATKFAVRGLTEALDIELRPRGVRVCDVMPGYVSTKMVHEQKIKSPIVGALGVRLEAGDVASTVWNAVHGDKVHWLMKADHALFARLSGFSSLARAIMKHMIRS
jgi:short-subunit dehydrogenase